MQPLLRPPVWARVYSVVFILVWLAIVGTFTIASGGGNGRLFGAVLGVVGVFITYRNLRTGVSASADTLEVRNQLKTYTLARADVEGFHTGSSSNSIGVKLVYVVTSSQGVVNAAVTQSVPFLPSSRRKLEEQLAILERWRSGSTT